MNEASQVGMGEVLCTTHCLCDCNAVKIQLLMKENKELKETIEKLKGQPTNTTHPENEEEAW